MDKKSKTPAEAWNEFIQLPDLRLRIRKAGLQVAVEEQAAELARQEQLIANLDLEKALMKQQHTEQLLQLQQLHTETVQSLAKDSSLTNTSIPEQTQALSSASAKSQQSRPPVGKCLSAYVESYINSINANREAEDKINEQGIGDHRRTCKLLIEILGDKPLSELNIRDRNYFDDVIKRYPVNREKKRELKGKTLEEILTLPDYEKINLKTAKFHASRANAFLNWVFRQEGLAKPFTLMEDVRIKKGKGAAKKRREFTTDELRVLFSPDHFPIMNNYEERSPYKFWIPLIGLHSGARINEIAQLRLTDIVEIDGIHCFHITEEGSDEEQGYLPKSVKTDAARRYIPIHSKLIELGLLEYIDGVKALGYHMLFEDLSHAKTKYGSLASKWFANYCDKVGLPDRVLTFHSLRHGAIGHTRRKQFAKDIRVVVLGHSIAKDPHDKYGDIKGDISIHDQKAFIEALDFSDSLDFVRLKKNALGIQDLVAIVNQKKK